MASSKEYLEFILGQLDGLKDVDSYAMMGEFVLYYRQKVIGGIYDNRLLLKVVPSAVELMPDCPRISPYQGAKEMLFVENVDDKAFLEKLLMAMFPDLPQPKPRKPKKSK